MNICLGVSSITVFTMTGRVSPCCVYLHLQNIYRNVLLIFFVLTFVPQYLILMNLQEQNQ